MKAKQCTWITREGIRCPDMNAALTQAWAGNNGQRWLCKEHANCATGKQGDIIAREKRAKLAETGALEDNALSARILIARKAQNTRKTKEALECYMQEVRRCEESGMDKDKAHEMALLHVWKVAEKGGVSLQ